jgi:sulfatase maturation enzyme AslB (radical SAM superfamily)
MLATMDNPRETYCAAAWTHLCSVPDRDTFNPCCGWSREADQPDIPFDHPDPLNHPWMQQLRQRMLNNEKVDGCSLCYRHEQDRGTSLRMNFNQWYGRDLDVTLRYLELNFGNLCNLKCRMCYSGFSSKWIADEISLGKTPRQLLRRHMRDSHINVSKLDRIRFTGGEPLMDQDQILEILRSVEQAQGNLKGLTCQLINNGSFDVDPELMQLFQRTRWTQLATSVDGMHAVNEYQRTGSKWNELESRLRFYDSLCSEQWAHQIALSLGTFNVTQLIEFTDWICRELPRTSVVIQPIYHPLSQCISNLPDWYKAQLISEFESWQPSDPKRLHLAKNTVINLLKIQRNMEINAMRAEITRLDLLRDERFSDVDPRTHAAIFG